MEHYKSCAEFDRCNGSIDKHRQSGESEECSAGHPGLAETAHAPLPKHHEMRRRDREILDRDEMLSIVSECDCCRLGLVDDGEAYIVPMNFGFEDRDGSLTLYFHCASEGRKLGIIGGGTEVSFEMDCGHALSPADSACAYSYEYKCVMGRGHIAPAANDDEKCRALRLIMAHYSGKSDWDFDGRIVSRLTVLKLTVTDWSCKKR